MSSSLDRHYLLIHLRRYLELIIIFTRRCKELSGQVPDCLAPSVLSKLLADGINLLGETDPDEGTRIIVNAVWTVPDVQADILNKGRRILRGRDLIRGLKPQNSVLEVLAPRTETCVGRFHVQCAADCSKLLFSANIRENVPLRMGMTAHLLLDAVAACTSRCKRHIAVF